MTKSEPSSVGLREVSVGEEATNAVLSLGFYAVCAVLGLAPRPIRGRLADAFVGWSEGVDQKRHG